MKEIIISSLEENQRIDKFLLRYMNNASKGFIYKMFRKKNIELNGRKVIGNEILKKDDVIKMFLSGSTIDKFMLPFVIKNNNGEVSVIYEDENILICNKPVGVLSHSQVKEDEDTMIDRIISYLNKKGEIVVNKESTFKPAICNRLDRNTSGIILCGKNLPAVQHLNDIFKNNKVEKYYKTIVKGNIHKKGVIETYYTKDFKNNKASVFNKKKDSGRYKRVKTEYYPIKVNKEYTLLEIKLITGKSHQIRVHLQSINHEVVGDTKYGDIPINNYLKSKIGLKHQLLHSDRVIFKDETGFLNYLNNKHFIAPLPNIFEKTLKLLDL